MRNVLWHCACIRNIFVHVLSYTECLPADCDGIQHTSTAVVGSGGAYLCSICMYILCVMLGTKYKIRPSVNFVVQNMDLVSA